MSESKAKVIERNRAPRVQIEYDVELYGAEKKVQLPFVMGVMSDLAGKSEVEQDRIMQQAALEEMARDPMRTLRLTAAKFLHWFDYSNALLSDDVLADGASSVRVDTWGPPITVVTPIFLKVSATS